MVNLNLRQKKKHPTIWSWSELLQLLQEIENKLGILGHVMQLPIAVLQ